MILFIGLFNLFIGSVLAATAACSLRVNEQVNELCVNSSLRRGWHRICSLFIEFIENNYYSNAYDVTTTMRMRPTTCSLTRSMNKL